MNLWWKFGWQVYFTLFFRQKNDLWVLIRKNFVANTAHNTYDIASLLLVTRWRCKKKIDAKQNWCKGKIYVIQYLARLSVSPNILSHFFPLHQSPFVSISFFFFKNTSPRDEKQRCYNIRIMSWVSYKIFFYKPSGIVFLSKKRSKINL